MRMFISIGFPPEINQRLEAITHALKNNAQCGSFTLPGNFHITLAFLGELTPSQVLSAQKALSQVQAAPFSIRLEKLGFWRRPDGALYWLAMEESCALKQLEKQVSFYLTKEGFALENRSFFPHLTLGRRVTIENQAAVHAIIEKMVPREEIKIDQAVLMASQRIDGKLCYIPQHRVCFSEG